MSDRKNKKRYDILETGKKLFLKHGVKRISVEEICREANVSKVTFYKHFKNKQQLLVTIRDSLMEIGFKKFDEINKLDISFEKKIQTMSKWRIEFFESIKGEFLDQIIKMDDFKREYMTRFITNIKTAQKNGEIKNDIFPELIALVIEKLREITIENKWRDFFDDYSTYQNQLRTLIFFGILTKEEKDKGDMK